MNKAPICDRGFIFESYREKKHVHEGRFGNQIVSHPAVCICNLRWQQCFCRWCVLTANSVHLLSATCGDTFLLGVDVGIKPLFWFWCFHIFTMYYCCYVKLLVIFLVLQLVDQGLLLVYVMLQFMDDLPQFSNLLLLLLDYTHLWCYLMRLHRFSMISVSFAFMLLTCFRLR